MACARKGCTCPIGAARRGRMARVSSLVAQIQHENLLNVDNFVDLEVSGERGEGPQFRQRFQPRQTGVEGADPKPLAIPGQSRNVVFVKTSHRRPSGETGVHADRKWARVSMRTPSS